MRTRIEDVTELLVNTALGKDKADLVVKNGTLINVNSRELIEGVGVTVKRGRIAAVGNVDRTIGDGTTVIDAGSKYIAPGFLDGHVHVESSMLTLTQFARAVIPRGTTAIFMDPHEIANVLGLRGVKLMVDEAKRLPLKAFICVPSCVPAAPNVETSGAELGLDDVVKALSWAEVVGLGEVMDYEGVLRCERDVHGKIKAALKIGKVIDGHACGLSEAEISAYVASGASSCHESITAAEAVQKLRLGMYVMVREASAWRDLAEVIKCVTEHGLDARHVCLITDDRHCETLLADGHVNAVIRRAVEEGVDPVVAIQMATLNTAERFGVNRDIGSVAPGKCADILILNDLDKVEVDTVIADGTVIAKDGKLLLDLAPPGRPPSVKKTVRLRRRLRAEDFVVRAPRANGVVEVRVIGLVEGKAATKHLKRALPINDGVVVPLIEDGIAKVAVVERHGRTGNVSLGFVKGFGLREGAVASSVAHDSHNIIAIGVNDNDMASAVNALADVGGGVIAIRNGRTLGLIELPIAGLMSDELPEVVCRKVKGLMGAWKGLGCSIESPFMNLSLLTLPVLPELRITDKGLFDVKEFKFVSLFV